MILHLPLNTWAEIFSAIGTCAAFFAVIWQVNHADKVRRKEFKMLARPLFSYQYTNKPSSGYTAYFSDSADQWTGKEQKRIKSLQEAASNMNNNIKDCTGITTIYNLSHEDAYNVVVVIKYKYKISGQIDTVFETTEKYGIPVINAKEKVLLILSPQQRKQSSTGIDLNVINCKLTYETRAHENACAEFKLKNLQKSSYVQSIPEYKYKKIKLEETPSNTSTIVMK